MFFFLFHLKINIILQVFTSQNYKARDLPLNNFFKAGDFPTFCFCGMFSHRPYFNFKFCCIIFLLHPLPERWHINESKLRVFITGLRSACFNTNKYPKFRMWLYFLLWHKHVGERLFNLFCSTRRLASKAGDFLYHVHVLKQWNKKHNNSLCHACTIWCIWNSVNTLIHVHVPYHDYHLE